MEENSIKLSISHEGKSVEKELRPTSYASWFLGAGIARPLRCPKIITIILRILQFGVCSVIVAYGAIDFFTFGSVFKSDTFKIMYYTNKVVCYISSYYYVFQGAAQQEKWPNLMAMFDRLDSRIRSECSIDNQSLIARQVVQAIALFLLGPVSLLSHAVYYYFTTPEDIFASDLLLYYTISQSLGYTFLYDMIVYVIYCRFKTINSMLVGVENLGVSWIPLKIRKVRELHLELCEIVAFVNQVHGLHLLLSSANSFTMVVATLFRIYMGVVEQKSDFIVINNLIWMNYAGQFALMCYVSTITRKEASITGRLIHLIALRHEPIMNDERLSKTRNNQVINNFLDSNDYTALYRGSLRMGRELEHMQRLQHRSVQQDRINIRNEIIDFSIQLQQNDVTFSALEFFEMDNHLLRSFISVITTYLIILVQFYRPENSPEAESLEQN